MDTKLESLQQAGRIAADIFHSLKKRIKVGVNALEIEHFVAETIQKNGMQPAFLGFKGYPATSCISINSAIVHGIPFNYQFQNGDVVTVDIGIKYNDWIVDTARTYGVGKISTQHQQLIDTATIALAEAVKVAKFGNTVGDISAAVQRTVENNGFYVVRELTGHGVGKTLQEKPSIPNYGTAHTGPKLEKGMVLAIEPIIATKRVRVVTLADGWTIASDDDTVSAHVEDTIMVTDTAPIVLTASK